MAGSNSRFASAVHLLWARVPSAGRWEKKKYKKKEPDKWRNIKISPQIILSVGFIEKWSRMLCSESIYTSRSILFVGLGKPDTKDLSWLASWHNPRSVLEHVSLFFVFLRWRLGLVSGKYRKYRYIPNEIPPDLERRPLVFLGFVNLLSRVFEKDKVSEK